MKYDISATFQAELETELARVLKEEIWKEITKETGKTQQDLDNEIIAHLRQYKEELDEIVPEVSYHLAIKTIKNLFVNAAGNINANDWKLDSNGSYYCTVTIYIMNDGKTKVLKELDKKELHIIVRDIISIVEDYGYNKPVVIYNRCKDRDGDDVTIKITLVDRNGT